MQLIRLKDFKSIEMSQLAIEDSNHTTVKQINQITL